MASNNGYYTDKNGNTVSAKSGKVTRTKAQDRTPKRKK